MRMIFKNIGEIILETECEQLSFKKYKEKKTK